MKYFYSTLNSITFLIKGEKRAFYEKRTEQKIATCKNKFYVFRFAFFLDYWSIIYLPLESLPSLGRQIYHVNILSWTLTFKSSLGKLCFLSFRILKYVNLRITAVLSKPIKTVSSSCASSDEKYKWNQCAI